MPAGSGITTSAASTCCLPRPRPTNRPTRSCATKVSRLNASRGNTARRRARPGGRSAGRPRQSSAGFHRHRPRCRPRPDRSGVRPGRPGPGPPRRPPAQAARLAEGPAGRAVAPPASPPGPWQRRRARRPARQPPASAGSGSPRPYPVHAARKEDPAARAARGSGASRQLHRRPAPHPGPARPAGRHGTGDPVRPRRTGHIAARRHPRPLPQGELIRANPDAATEAGGRPGNQGGHNPTPRERPSTPRSSRPPLLPVSRRGLTRKLGPGWRAAANLGLSGGKARRWRWLSRRGVGRVRGRRLRGWGKGSWLSAGC
jgi:hypothetical protein